MADQLHSNDIEHNGIRDAYMHDVQTLDSILFIAAESILTARRSLYHNGFRVLRTFAAYEKEKQQNEELRYKLEDSELRELQTQEQVEELQEEIAGLEEKVLLLQLDHERAMEEAMAKSQEPEKRTDEIEEETETDETQAGEKDNGKNEKN